MSESSESQLRSVLQASDRSVEFDAEQFTQRVLTTHARRIRFRRLVASCSFLFFLFAILAWKFMSNDEAQQHVTTHELSRNEVSQELVPDAAEFSQTDLIPVNIEIELADLGQQRERLQALSEKIDKSKDTFERLNQMHQEQVLTFLRAEASREVEVPDLADLGL